MSDFHYLERNLLFIVCNIYANFYCDFRRRDKLFIDIEPDGDMKVILVFLSALTVESLKAKVLDKISLREEQVYGIEVKIDGMYVALDDDSLECIQEKDSNVIRVTCCK